MTGQETPTTGRAKPGSLDDPRDSEPGEDAGASAPSLSDPRFPSDAETKGGGSQPGGGAFQIIDLGEGSRDNLPGGRERRGIRGGAREKGRREKAKSGKLALD